MFRKSSSASYCRRFFPWVLLVAVAGLYGHTGLAGDYSYGITAQGNTGGLVIPYAHTLASGAIGLGYSNYREPLFGAPRANERNFVLGLGLSERVELFGRLAEVTNPSVGGTVNGTRDISANIKIKLLDLGSDGPQISAGINDIKGGANYFRSMYGVATLRLGAVGLTAGYAKGRSADSAPHLKPAFDGPFAGINIPLGRTGASVLAEREGRQTHVGLRWTSDSISTLANGLFSVSLQRSSSTQNIPGLKSPSTFAALSLVIPLEGNESIGSKRYEAQVDDFLPPIGVAGGETNADLKSRADLDERLAVLRARLLEVGLERIRVGKQGDAVVVQYENHRYAHDELDALGLVFGLAAEAVKSDAVQIRAITLKNGLPVYESSADVRAIREFLRGGTLSDLKESLAWRGGPSEAGYDRGVIWVDEIPSLYSPVRVEIKPDLNYTIATDVGVFDYALAANVGLSVPLWSGSQVFANYIFPVGRSENMEDGQAFAVMRQRSGLRSFALQQSFWLDRFSYNQISVGRFHYGVAGIEGESSIFIPRTDDVVRLTGAFYSSAPGGMVRSRVSGGIIYRHQLNALTTLEVGGQQYTDGSRGPSIEWGRWFGNVNVKLFYRRGGYAKFAGLQLSIPLTPRQGMMPGNVFVTGSGLHAQEVRTRMTDGRTRFNTVLPGGVQPLRLETSQTVDAQLNHGRMSLGYLKERAYKIKEAFFSYTTRTMRQF